MQQPQQKCLQLSLFWLFFSSCSVPHLPVLSLMFSSMQSLNTKNIYLHHYKGKTKPCIHFILSVFVLGHSTHYTVFLSSFCRSFKRALNDVVLSRRAISNMNTLYPDATPEELMAVDNVCIICREEMMTGASLVVVNVRMFKQDDWQRREGADS